MNAYPVAPPRISYNVACPTCGELIEVLTETDMQATDGTFFTRRQHSHLHLANRFR